MVEIRLHNSKTRKKDPFTPIDPDNVRMYVCGPTVYDRAHLGNARPVVVFDVLFRLLRHGHVYGADHVTYVRNFTDVDDKINARARQMQEDGDTRDLNTIIRALTDETIGWYHADMDALGALRPTHEPRATEFIPQMVKMIEGLVDSGHAYAAEGHVLFDVRAYPDYGRLSGRSLDDMIAGARVEVAPYKRDPMDFVLWKPSADDEPGWPSPWGKGRPGWHIECSAMSHELLGDHFDIHGGGIDLAFPHHENEVAQSCCAHPEAGFANVWLHNEMVQVDGKKMSKSLGNFFTVKDLLDQGWPGEVIRFVMLSTHYRKPMDWTEEKAREARETLDWWATTFSTDPEVLAAARLGEGAEFRIDAEVVAALSDDLNTSRALTRLKKLGRFLDNSSEFLNLEATQQFSHRLDFILSVEALGIPLISLSTRKRRQGLSLAKAETMMNAERMKALSDRDFSRLDQLKISLGEMGVEVRMSKDGVELIPGPDFDPAKLDAPK
ncbi:cysteine--tRNA ligase [Roseicitreum antarcticum]|uniref:Cysteine--tRNA ligase n=1 Tax=Roseicitreum antarcticum TaxID=564137 RepID=A0A1H3A6X6_9RHOB|nr:cysteine--tRNA ligase [Roseicitreum antarcticum]SDX25500.1 cysteinyl-tRNA synthetase [Roseicitreum antarcticum]